MNLISLCLFNAPTSGNGIKYILVPKKNNIKNKMLYIKSLELAALVIAIRNGGQKINPLNRPKKQTNIDGLKKLLFESLVIILFAVQLFLLFMNM